MFLTTVHLYFTCRERSLSLVDTEPRLGVSLGVTEVEVVVVGAILRAGCGSLSAPSSDVLPLQRSVSQRQAVTRDEEESEMSSMSHFAFTPSGRLTFPRTIERLIHSLTIPVFDLNLQNCHHILCTSTLESLVGL